MPASKNVVITQNYENPRLSALLTTVEASAISRRATIVLHTFLARREKPMRQSQLQNSDGETNEYGPRTDGN